VNTWSAATRRTPRDELADDTAHGELYLARLRRAQLELSVLGLVAFGGLVGSLPLLLALAPGLSHLTLFGIPVAALLVVVPAYPLFVVIALVYQRRADALDESFRALVRDE
jgi:putative solute:sodium symporter small subunit